MKKITKGNEYDSRLGGRRYAMWTTGYDVCIEEEGGKKYFYRLRCYEYATVERISPVELENPEELEWMRLHEAIRLHHFYDINPSGTEQEMNLCVYGEEEGEKINARNEWAETHRIYSRDITLDVLDELGQFEKVKFLKSESGRDIYAYLIDDKWLVSVITRNITVGGEYYDTYRVSDYEAIKDRRREFGRRVARLAKKADVPWEVGVFAGNIADEDEAVEVLKRVKYAKEHYANYTEIRYELSCGIGRRTAAIEYVLGEELWHKLDCSGQNQTSTLAWYLSSEE